MADEQKIQDQSINKMTIPELRRAKSICEKKIEENEDKPSVVNKLKLMVSKFEKAERIINRYYEKTIKRNPSIVHASRNMLTLAKIGKQMKDSGFSGKASSVAAFLTNANMGKVTLGVGVAALGFGVANTIAHAVTANLASTSAFAGKGIMGVIFEALKLIPGLNPASIALLSVGAGLLIGRKLLPYIFRTAKKMSEHNTQIRKAENEIAEEQYNNSQGFDNSSLLADAFKKDRSKVVSVLFDHPDMLKEYKKLLADKNSDLNTTQRINLTEAIREAEGKLKDAKGKYKEAFAGSSKAGGSKKKALESRAEEFEAHPREGAPDGEEPKVEPVAPDGGEPAAPTGEEPAAPTGEEPTAPTGEEPAAPTGEEPTAPTGEEPTAPDGGEPTAPDGGEPAEEDVKRKNAIEILKQAISHEKGSRAGKFYGKLGAFLDSTIGRDSGGGIDAINAVQKALKNTTGLSPEERENLEYIVRLIAEARQRMERDGKAHKGTEIARQLIEETEREKS